MWWRSARIALAAALLAGLAAASAGCGFSPLYGGADGERAAAALASVRVLPIEGPLGVEMRNRLLDGLVPASFDNPARYELTVRLSASASAQVTERNTQIRRHLLVLDADYALASAAEGRELLRARARVETSYNIVSGEDYSTLVARRNAEEQAARDAAREIAERLAVYFRRRAGE